MMPSTTAVISHSANAAVIRVSTHVNASAICSKGWLQTREYRLGYPLAHAGCRTGGSGDRRLTKSRQDYEEFFQLWKTPIPVSLS